MSKLKLVAPALLLLSAFGLQGQTGTDTITAAYQGGPIPILGEDADTISIANILVASPLKVTKVTVKVQVDFARVGDLSVSLFGPEGNEVQLLAKNCGDLRNIDTTFDDDAQSKYADFCPTEAGRGPFRPNGQLADYKDQIATGLWTVAVTNTESDRLGWLRSAAVTISGTNVVSPIFRKQTVLNAASLRYSGTVAPGEMVAIAGYGLGPSAGVKAPAGNLPTTLGGTTVTYNGTAIPIQFASSFYVVVQIPNAAVPGSTGTLQINYNNQNSANVTVDVYNTRPGIFTTQQSGSGPAKAINQSGTVNSKSNPALKGSVISVYVSGLGSTTPAVAAGTVTPSGNLAYVDNAVAASIGGVPCQVTFAGLAPGMVGVYQVNVLVEQNVSSGTKELILSNGGNPSQEAVSVEIR